VATGFDPNKEAANIRKHGISLTEGDGVLSDPLAITVEDTSAVGELRFVTIGANVFGQLRVVLYAHRGEEQRIISVRKPDPKEVREYEKAV
jgi:uncharacterized DUF497 family protein